MVAILRVRPSPADPGSPPPPPADPLERIATAGEQVGQQLDQIRYDIETLSGIPKLKAELEQSQHKVESLTREVTTLKVHYERQIATLKGEYERSRAEVAAFEGEIDRGEGEVAALKEKIEHRDREILRLLGALEESERQTALLTTRLENEAREIAKVRGELGESERDVREMKAAIQKVIQGALQEPKFQQTGKHKGELIPELADLVAELMTAAKL